MNKQSTYILIPTEQRNLPFLCIVQSPKVQLEYWTELYRMPCQPQHLYILSDEEIKEGDYWISSSDETLKDAIWIGSIPIVKGKYDKKIIATTNPELTHKIHEGNHFEVIDGIPSISQSDIEYIISLYNDEMAWQNSFDKSQKQLSSLAFESRKEVNIEKLSIKQLEEILDKYRDDSYSVFETKKELDKLYNQCLQDNADKKFTKSDLFIFVGFYGEKKKMGMDGEAIVKEYEEAMKAHSQPKRDTVMVEYERESGVGNPYLDDVKSYPKLKSGCIVIVRE